MTDDVSWDLGEFRKDEELSKLFQTTPEHIFRWLHYHGGDERHFSVDIDMAWVNAEPVPHIAGFVEYKNETETVSFPQAVFFEAISSVAPVYIIRGQADLMDTHPSDHRFDVHRFSEWDRSGDGAWIETELVAESVPWGREINGCGDLDPRYHEGVLAFEDSIRQKARDRGGNGRAAVTPSDITAWGKSD